jgi:hypothetical protein
MPPRSDTPDHLQNRHALDAKIERQTESNDGPPKLDPLGADVSSMKPIDAVRTSHGNTFYRLDSSDAEAIESIANHRDRRPSTANAVNKQLHLNLGLPVNPNNPSIRKVAKFLSDSNVWTERIAVAIWLRIPLLIRHKVRFSNFIQFCYPFLICFFFHVCSKLLDLY